MQTIHIIVLIGGVWLLLGLFFWALIHGSDDAQADIEQPGSSGGVDDTQAIQDMYDRMAARYGGNTCTTSYGPAAVVGDPDAWKHSSVKVPHADSSAATFHRAGDA